MQTGQLSTEQIISAAVHLSPPDLDELLNRVRAVRQATHAPIAEMALLARIRQPWPAWRKRMRELMRKRTDSSISETEYKELTSLSNKAEEWHAERMMALVGLAQLRGVTLPVVMEQLGISFPEPAE